MSFSVWPTKQSF